MLSRSFLVACPASRVAKDVGRGAKLLAILALAACLSPVEDSTPIEDKGAVFGGGRVWRGGDVYLALDYAGVDSAQKDRFAQHFQTVTEEIHRETPVRLHVLRDAADAPVGSDVVRLRVQPEASGGEAPLGLGGEARSDARSLRHEIGHVLGMVHTQSRPDRDRHVRIHTPWIVSEYIDDHLLRPRLHPVGPYDVASVMHYGSFAASRFGSAGQCATISPRTFDADEASCLRRSELGHMAIENTGHYSPWDYTTLAALYCDTRFCSATDRCAPRARCESTSVRRHLSRLYAWEATEDFRELRHLLGPDIVPSRRCQVAGQGLADRLVRGQPLPDKSPLGCVWDLEGASLRGVRLPGIDLSLVRAADASMREADLANASLVHSDWSGASFHGARLARADLRGATLQATVFDGADLRGAQLLDADWILASFRNADLTDADLRWSADARSWSRINFDGASLRGARFRGRYLDGSSFVGADIGGADFCGAHNYDLAGSIGIPSCVDVPNL